MFEFDESTGTGPRGFGSRFSRRAFLTAAGAAFAGYLIWSYERQEAIAEAAPAEPPKQVSIVEFSDSGVRKGVVSVLTIQKSEADWRRQLPRASFEITRH